MHWSKLKLDKIIDELAGCLNSQNLLIPWMDLSQKPALILTTMVVNIGFSSGLNHLEPGGQNRTDLFPTNPGDWSDLKIKLSFDWLKSCFVYLCTRETRDYTGPKLIDHHTSIL